MRKQRELKERFWEKVDRRGKDECWEWTGAKNQKGDGMIRCGQRKLIKAHRLSWELCVKKIPFGFQVLHHCDNPSCMNPKHLFLGTNQDNVNDKMKKGRFPNFVGENNPCSKLTEYDVILIRRLYEPRKYSQYRLAREFGVTRGTISKALSKATWGHI